MLDLIKSLEKLLRAKTASGVDCETHLGELLIDLLHEGDDKVHEFVLQHFVGVIVGY